MLNLPPDPSTDVKIGMKGAIDRAMSPELQCVSCLTVTLSKLFDLSGPMSSSGIAGEGRYDTS